MSDLWANLAAATAPLRARVAGGVSPSLDREHAVARTLAYLDHVVDLTLVNSEARGHPEVARVFEEEDANWAGKQGARPAHLLLRISLPPVGETRVLPFQLSDVQSLFDALVAMAGQFPRSMDVLFGRGKVLEALRAAAGSAGYHDLLDDLRIQHHEGYKLLESHPQIFSAHTLRRPDSYTGEGVSAIAASLGIKRNELFAFNGTTVPMVPPGQPDSNAKDARIPLSSSSYAKEVAESNAKLLKALGIKVVVGINRDAIDRLCRGMPGITEAKIKIWPDTKELQPVLLSHGDCTFFCIVNSSHLSRVKFLQVHGDLKGAVDLALGFDRTLGVLRLFSSPNVFPAIPGSQALAGDLLVTKALLRMDIGYQAAMELIQGLGPVFAARYPIVADSAAVQEALDLLVQSGLDDLAELLVLYAEFASNDPALLKKELDKAKAGKPMLESLNGLLGSLTVRARKIRAELLETPLGIRVVSKIEGRDVEGGLLAGDQLGQEPAEFEMEMDTTEDFTTVQGLRLLDPEESGANKLTDPEEDRLLREVVVKVKSQMFGGHEGRSQGGQHTPSQFQKDDARTIENASVGGAKNADTGFFGAQNPKADDPAHQELQQQAQAEGGKWKGVEALIGDLIRGALPDLPRTSFVVCPYPNEASAEDSEPEFFWCRHCRVLKQGSFVPRGGAQGVKVREHKCSELQAALGAPRPFFRKDKLEELDHGRWGSGRAVSGTTGGKECNSLRHTHCAIFFEATPLHAVAALNSWHTSKAGSTKQRDNMLRQIRLIVDAADLDSDAVKGLTLEDVFADL
ncbi:hypothetical protein DFJ74DRAFT_677089 [Hyaloraphidium curvatum]|nr:hypothetical protein DFJ74DRAFT_677089 [Hyaloraphidium curvatum]